MKTWLKLILVAITLAGPIPGCSAGTSVVPGRPVPRLLDLGSVGCIPCKAMAPILDGLRTEYAGRMKVDFVDVWKDRAAAGAHRVRMIPTQIFFGPDGKELARHEGFTDRAGILAQWKALGVSL